MADMVLRNCLSSHSPSHSAAVGGKSEEVSLPAGMRWEGLDGTLGAAAVVFVVVVVGVAAVVVETHIVEASSDA